MDTQKNYMTKPGAQVLVNRIYAYWAKRGVYPHIWLESKLMKKEGKEGSSDPDDLQRLYFIRSDIAEKLSRPLVEQSHT